MEIIVIGFRAVLCIERILYWHHANDFVRWIDMKWVVTLCLAYLDKEKMYVMG